MKCFDKLTWIVVDVEVLEKDREVQLSNGGLEPGKLGDYVVQYIDHTRIVSRDVFHDLYEEIVIDE